jgi:hypothetical protein
MIRLTTVAFFCTALTRQAAPLNDSVCLLGNSFSGASNRWLQNFMIGSFLGARRLGSTRRLLLLALTFWAFGFAARGAQFYLDSRDGNDSQDGRTPAKAWRTLDRASQARLAPGDSLLLRGQHEFRGSLQLNPQHAGTSAKPVIIGSYGQGRAIINAGTGYAVLVTNAAGIEVRDLVCIGGDRTLNHGAGVAFINSLPGSQRLRYLRIRNVEARGFGRELPQPKSLPEGYQLPQGAGILVAGNATDGSKSGFEDVEITDCVCQDNAYYGILVTGYWNAKATDYANANVHIANCRVFENPGDPLYHENHSGSGILVEDCDGGLVEKCVAYENGRLCHDAPGGPCGIWTAIARRVVIQDCESFRNRTSAADGDGFDLDGGGIECVLQYNHSHDNDGAGFLVYTYTGAPHTDRANVVRWNVSENDSVRLHSYGGICLGNSGKGMSGVRVYNNTVVITRTNDLPDALLTIQGQKIEAYFWNNLLIGPGSVPLVRVSRDAPGIVFQGNGYGENGQPLAMVGERAIKDLAGWRSLGKEVLQDQLTGQTVAAPVWNLTPGASSRREMAKRLRPGTGLNGIDLQQFFGISPGPRDFAGKKLDGARSIPIGALCEW